MMKKLFIITLASLLVISCNSGNTKKGNDNNSNNDDRAVGEQVNISDDEYFLLIGTYTAENESEGIYVHKFDTGSGKHDSISMAKISNPSYLTISPDENYVYAVEEGGDNSSSASAFKFDKSTGTLSFINNQPTMSSGPCYITIDSKGKNVHTANYGGGTISSFQTNSNGSLNASNSLIVFEGSGPIADRQEAPHLHCVDYSFDGKYIFASDLGTDKIYRFDAVNSPFDGQPAFQRSSLKEFAMPEGTGPRHFAFHPNGGRYMYVLGELSGQVIVFDYNYGDIVQKQVIASDTTGAQGSADIHISPDGRFLYSSNRLQNDGIAIFSINEEDGTLTKVGYQLTAKHPRNFVITPNGKFILVAGRDDNKVQVFSRDADTGLLTDTNNDIMVYKPTCLKFVSM
ncbi:MAG: lactonase family protein [Fermentimonas sp.]|jgi:6-phosphogluconolactonase